MKCKHCEKGKNCIDCFSLIDGVSLQRKLKVPRKVVLETCDGEQCIGELYIVSPVGLGIKVVELIPSENYIIKIQDDFCIKVGKIKNRGKDNYYGFDILEVTRTGSTSTRLILEEYKALTMNTEQLIDEITQTLPDNVKSIVQERLKTELEKAKVFDSLKVGQTMKYQRGAIKPLSGKVNELKLRYGELVEIARKSQTTGVPCREVLFAEGDTVYDVHSIPFDYQSGGILIIDVSSIIRNEREMKKREFKIYQEAISAVTGGRLLVVAKEEISSYIKGVQPNLEIKIQTPQELDFLRNEIKELVKDRGISDKDCFLLLVCISEAVTNALKHAKGGLCRAWVMEDKIRVEISDQGSGISFKDLPKATLMQNFSTTNSLGCGFTILLKFLDKIILATDPDGTTVILDKVIF